MHSGGLPPRELAHAFGCPSRRGRENGFEAEAVIQIENGADTTRFARARPTGNDQQAVAEGKLKCLALCRCIRHGARLLQISDHPVNVPRRGDRRTVHQL